MMDFKVRLPALRYFSKLILSACMLVFVLNLLMLYKFFGPFDSISEPSLLPPLNFNIPSISQAKLSTEFFDIDFNVVNISTCNLTDLKALSAIKRAKTDKCRDQLHKISCLMRNNVNKTSISTNFNRYIHPTRLPRQCPLSNPNNEAYWIGCYQDNVSKRILNNGVFNLDKNSPDACVAYCIRLGQEIAGLSNRTFCYCGSKSDLNQAKTTSDKDCDHFECPGDDLETCGGSKALAAYKTGVGTIQNVAVEFIDEPNDGFLSLIKPKLKIAFLLQFNGRSVRQMQRLLKLIYRPHHFYYVHIDKRQSYSFESMLALEAKLNVSNFRVKRNRFETIWGGTELLTMLLDSIQDLFTMKNSSNFDYLINLSESDMPLMPVEDLERFLSEYNATNFVKGQPSEVLHRFLLKQGLERVFYQCEGRMWQLGPRRVPENVVFDGGSDWVALHRTFLHYAAFSQDELVVGLKQMFKFVLLPAESFFHMLLLNSVFCLKFTNQHNLRLTNWVRRHGCKCQHKHIVDWCGCSPNVYKMEHSQKLDDESFMRKNLKFFARKFDPTISLRIINRLDEKIRQKHPHFSNYESSPSWETFWQNEFDSKIDPINNMTLQSSPIFFELALHSWPGCLPIDKSDLKPTLHYSVSKLWREDRFTMLIIEVEDPQKQVSFQMGLQREILMVENSTNPFGLEVGSYFDLKEDLFRHEIPVFMEKTNPEISINITGPFDKFFGSKLQLNWIDPNGIIKDQKFFLVSKNHDQWPKHYTLKLGPLDSGVWFVNLTDLATKSTLQSANFLILPSKLDQKTTIIKNFDKFFKSVDICLVNLGISNKKCQKTMEKCEKKWWSTKYTDPKSEIESIDLKSGLIRP